MVTTTTFPGLVTLDPIQGLIDYVADIKPYHSKVFETSVEYVYTEYVNVNILDVNDLNISLLDVDNINTSVNENSSLAVPTNISEMFDFFITAPDPITISLLSTDITNNIVYFTGNITSSFQIGQLVVIDGSSSGNNGQYKLLTVGYNHTTSQTEITLNGLLGTNGTTGNVTLYPTDSTYNFSFPIQSAVIGPIVVTEPVTGTTFTVSTFTVQQNVTRAIQPGSIFQAVTSLNHLPSYLYKATFVKFVPSFRTDGSRNPSADTTIIGVTLDSVFTSSVISSGFIIPYNITGYDNRYDAPYDGMAGYNIVSG